MADSGTTDASPDSAPRRSGPLRSGLSRAGSLRIGAAKARPAEADQPSERIPDQPDQAADQGAGQLAAQPVIQAPASEATRAGGSTRLAWSRSRPKRSKAASTPIAASQTAEPETRSPSTGTSPGSSTTGPSPGSSTTGRSTTGKGRPTPKRREAQSRRGARRGAVPPPPTTRKEAAQRAREQAAAERAAGRSGSTRLGGEEHFLPRDAGPVRRRVRDLVDSRRNVGVLLLPVTLLVVIASFSPSPQFLQIAFTAWITVILAMLLDLVFTAVRLSRRLRADFPGEKPGKHVAYGLLRSTVIRRLRTPKPRVNIGDTG